MNKDEIITLIKEAKLLGLKSLEVDGIKVEFCTIDPDTIKKPELLEQTPQEYKDLISPLSKYDELSDEEILYWSCDHGKTLEEQKKQEQIDNLNKSNKDQWE